MIDTSVAFAWKYSFKDLILLSRALKEVFKTLFMRGFSHYDRQLRNDILVITTIIAQNPGAPMIVSMSQIALISMVEVVGMREGVLNNVVIFMNFVVIANYVVMSLWSPVVLPVLCNLLET